MYIIGYFFFLFRKEVFVWKVVRLINLRLGIIKWDLFKIKQFEIQLQSIYLFFCLILNDGNYNWKDVVNCFYSQCKYRVKKTLYLEFKGNIGVFQYVEDMQIFVNKSLYGGKFLFIILKFYNDYVKFNLKGI